MECCTNTASLQSSYRALHSIETAMARVVSDMLISIDSKLLTMLLSFEISMAFNALDHNWLLRLANELFRFRWLALDWLPSYFSEQEQFVTVSRH